MGSSSSSLARLTKEELATYEAEFKATDADGNGYLTKEELVVTFTRLGMSATSAAAVAADYIDNHDTSGDGKVSWKEFVAVYEKQRAKLAEDYEAAAASLSDRFKAAKAPAEGMSKDDAVALVRAVGEAGDMVAGTDNAIAFRIRESAAAAFSLADLTAILKDVMFADGKLKAPAAAAAPAAGASGGAGAAPAAAPASE